MKQPKCVMVDGSKPDDGQTIMVDHIVTEFKVVIRHTAGAGPADVKQLLQSKYEVVRCEVSESTVYCTSGAADF